MPAPSLTTSLLSSLGGSPSLSTPAPAAQAWRDGPTGAFARELQQRLQAQVQTPPPSPPPVQPPARPVPAPAPAPAASSPPPANGRASEGASAPAPETRAGEAGQGEREGEGQPRAEDASPADEAATAPTAGSPGDAQRHLQRQRAERSRLDPGLASAAAAAEAQGDVDAETAAVPGRGPARRLRADDDGTTVAMPPATPIPPVALPPDDVATTRGLGTPEGAGTGPLAASPAAASDAAVSDPAATPLRAGQDLLVPAAAVAVDDAALSGAVAAGAARAPRADDALRHAAEGDRPGAALAALAGQQAALDGERSGTVGRQVDDNPQAVGSVTPASGLPAFAGELARAASALGGPQPAAAPAHAAVLNLPTPVTAPEFVPRLSGELAVLARDGVQEARINVHPVELGPISVQIAVDGATAQVHLAVDNAQTRDLLEQSMPTLAAALRDTGLTLTGGGVFQQSRQAPQDQPAPQQASGLRGRGDGSTADERDGAAPAAPARRLRAVGAVDVFA